MRLAITLLLLFFCISYSEIWAFDSKSNSMIASSKDAPKNIQLSESEITKQLDECCKIYKKYSHEVMREIRELIKMKNLYEESSNQLGVDYADDLRKKLVSDLDTIDWIYDVMYVYNNLKKCDDSKIKKYVFEFVDGFLFNMKSQGNALNEIELGILKKNKQDSLIMKYRDYDRRNMKIIKTIMKNKELLDR
jgi:hypothetical protein